MTIRERKRAGERESEGERKREGEREREREERARGREEGGGGGGKGRKGEDITDFTEFKLGYQIRLYHKSGTFSPKHFLSVHWLFLLLNFVVVSVCPFLFLPFLICIAYPLSPSPPSSPPLSQFSSR